MFCAGKDGSALSESFCKGQPKPAPTRPCNTKKCDGVWFTSNWTQVYLTVLKCCFGFLSDRICIFASLAFTKLQNVSDNNALHL